MEWIVWALIIGAILYVVVRARAGAGSTPRPPWTPPANAVQLRQGLPVETVGESHYQGALERICGGRTADGAHHSCLALLVPEPSNQQDANAVRIEIEDQLVGYLNRIAAKAYQPVARQLAETGQVAMVTAVIVGGWERDHGDRGSFGVQLNFRPPD